MRELAGTPQLGVTVDTGGTGQMSFATGLLLGRHNRSIASETIYSTTTVGAFAAHVYGFKGGGIRQLREYVEVLERCVGVGEGGRGYQGATFKASTQKKDQVGCVVG